MKKHLRVFISHITNRIHCGYSDSVNGDVEPRSDNKTNVTFDAIWAVAHHAINYGAPLKIAVGDEAYEITVKKIRHTSVRDQQ